MSQFDETITSKVEVISVIINHHTQVSLKDEAKNAAEKFQKTIKKLKLGDQNYAEFWDTLD